MRQNKEKQGSVYFNETRRLKMKNKTKTVEEILNLEIDRGTVKTINCKDSRGNSIKMILLMGGIKMPLGFKTLKDFYDSLQKNLKMTNLTDEQCRKIKFTIGLLKQWYSTL